MNLVIITSVINISRNPLDYAKIRSVYSVQERYEQTIKTLQSLSAIPNKHVLFVETSELTPEQESEIKKYTDFYVNAVDSEEVRNVINGPYKAAAESTQILEGLKIVDLSKYENIFKISGRYWLDQNFDFERYNNDHNIFLEGPNQSALATVMYKINKNYLDLYNNTLNFCKTSQGMLEADFITFFRNKYTATNKLGISGNVSVDGNPISW